MKYFEKTNQIDRLLKGLTILIFSVAVLLTIISHTKIFNSTYLNSEGFQECGIRTLENEIQNVEAKYNYFIAVVGDGVPEVNESPALNRPYVSQFAQGFDMFQGASQYYSKLSEDNKNSIGIIGIDDGGNTECAKSISSILIRSPKLLGVIGHANSSTTKEAAIIYKSANIPFLIPAATSPNVLPKNGKNTFRLPSNDEIQSLVIKDIVTKKENIRVKKFCTVYDNSPDAAEYSGYLHRKFLQFYNIRSDSVVHEGSYPVSLKPLNYSSIINRVVSSNIDCVVFFGYGSMAREFLLGLDYEFQKIEINKNGKISRPLIILSDGCKIPDIDQYNFEIYLTFPSGLTNDCSQIGELQETSQYATKYNSMFDKESFEIFGFDAAHILVTSILKLGSEASREKVISEISKFTTPGSCYTYQFENGENIRYKYYCYDIKTGKIKYPYDTEEINSLKYAHGL